MSARWPPVRLCGIAAVAAGVATLLLGCSDDGSASGVLLNGETWDKETAFKTVFVKFMAPWCGHCKSMKPAWDKLIQKYEGHESVLIGDVDCTGAARPLCQAVGVKGFPTLKYGDPHNLTPYEGGRDYAALERFAEENLKPQCSPSHLDLCDDDKKKLIAEFMELDDETLDERIATKGAESQAAEDHFQAEVKKLEKQYEELVNAKSAKVADIKNSGLNMMKTVRKWMDQQQTQGQSEKAADL
eukprot:TRINITY_DN21334_c0_g1_i1.p1 TRINITY_DN21334_c0_g1~~TRINITY_DN21334_c0_g1_i1.p1  ORF type:complete len:243 (-),score=66.54 TRINITY_DN21334_c0_g1_i1:159-887(-)